MITKLIFQILKALTNTCFNMHILFSNQSYSISSPTVLYCYNHMYRTFTDSKLLCCLAHRCIMFYNIICNLDGSLLDIIFQKNPPANTIFTMYAGEILHMLPIFSSSTNFFHFFSFSTCILLISMVY